MFRANQANPYDDIVAKATDENLTGENWEVILNLCDKVQEEGEQGARNVIAALLKRLAHRSPNVQLYALSLGESLSKNCGIDLHRELASRAFTGALEKLVLDRTTHDKVRRRALGLVAMWTAEFEHDPTLGIMETCYNNLKAKNYQFETPSEPAPPSVDDEARRREEEELQRALEISMRDKGGRSTYAPATSAGSSGGAAKHASGYVPAQSPSPKDPAYAANNSKHPNARTTSGYSATSGGVPAMAASSTSSLPSQVSTPVVTRVRAMHTFEPTEPGELAFEKGDVIKVVDRGYKDWWRGQLKGRTGIFPVNYVEPLPEPTAAEIAREAEQEAAVFAQAANVDRLLTMLRSLDASRENLADNEEIQELYRSCMSLRPRIVKLIDKYNQKRADLVSMNESFVKARTIFDRIMEDSLARHTAMYDSGPQPYGYGYEQPQPYGYGPNNAYQHQVEHQPQSQPQPGPPQQPDPAYAYQQGQVYGGPVGGAPYPQSAQIPYPQTSQTHYPQQQPQQQQQPQPQPQPQLHSQPQQPQIQQSAEYSPGVHAQQSQPQLQPQTQQQPPQSAGPPYVFDPNATYPDPNAQAWAQYYAQGGTDPAGAVYFISVPGVSDTPSPPEQTPQSHQPSLDPYQAQPQQLPAHQELTRQSSTSQRATYTDPNPQPSQYPSQPYYQDPASAPQVSPTSATGGMSSLQRASSATAGVPVPYSYHSPSHQQQLSPIGQSGYAGPGSEGHGYAQPASDGYEAPTPGGYAQSPPSGPGYGSSPSGEYPQGPGARGNVHTLQDQFLDMSIGGPQAATS